MRLLTHLFLLLPLIASVANAQTKDSENLAATTHRIESRSMDLYMSADEERAIMQRLREPFFISSSIRTLRALPIAFDGHLPIVIDERSLAEIGITLDAEFNVGAGTESRPAGASLIWILEQLDLTFLIRNARLEIMTNERADEKLSTRIYDITPLLTLRRRNGQAEVDTTAIEETIWQSIRPDSWECLGGPSTMKSVVVRNRCLLVVAAPTMVQLELDQLLNQMDRTSARPEQGVPRESRELLPDVFKPVIQNRVGLPVFGGAF